MPTLVNYNGDAELCAAGSGCSMDSGLLFSICSHADVYCPPRKRTRISCPIVVVVEQERKTSIETLPDECLFEIFRRLPEGQDRSEAACVSKRWLMILSSVRKSEIVATKSDDAEMVEADEEEVDGCLTRCVEGRRATDVRLAAIAVGTATRGGLGKLAVRGSNRVTALGLSSIARGCPSLKTLSLWNVPALGDEGLAEIARECHLLEKLDLCQCPLVSNKGVIAIAERCPNLTSLTIDMCLEIGNESLQAIARSCPKLQHVSIRACPLVGDVGVATLLSLASSGLRKVKLQSLNITDFSLAVIGHYGKSITSLVLSELQFATEKGFWAMGSAGGLQSLTSLAINSCWGMTGVGLEAIGKGCPILKQMSLRKCYVVSDCGLVAFANSAGSLESLQLEACNRISQQGILGALSGCKSKLKSLSLVNCMGIRDLAPDVSNIFSPCESLRTLTIRNCLGFVGASLEVIGRLCPQLENLDLSGLAGVTDSELLHLLESSEPRLVKVILSDCVNLTDDLVLALVRLHGETLEVINLEGCKKITDQSLMAIAENCLPLRGLYVSKCSISDAGISSLSRGQLGLQVLSLSGCSRLSDKSMPCLRKLGQTLKALDLKQCNSISSSTVDLLVETLWRCDIVS